jgi:glutathione S-transferase
MRARMGIASAGIRCELREVVLRDKPDAMIAISPKGTVPVLLLPDGTVIDESLDIMRWALDRNDPENWLSPDGASAAETVSLIEQAEDEFKPHLDRYKYPNRYDNAIAAEHRAEACRFVDLLEARLKRSRYLFSKQACIADIAVFPFLRQFANTDKEWWEASPFPRTRKWLEGLIATPGFISAMKKYRQWREGDEPVLFPE